MGANSLEHLGVLGGKRKFAVAGAIILLGLLFGIGEKWANSTARAIGDAEVSQLAASNAALLESELDKFRLLPIALAEHPDVVALAGGQGDAARVNARLEFLATQTSADSIFVIRADGVGLATSYRSPGGFAGQRHEYRPYFEKALEGGVAEVFSQSVITDLSGLYIARRIGTAEAPLGVIVVRISFKRLEKTWALQRGPTFVRDPHDIVVISGHPDWHFHTLRPLRPEEQQEIAQTRLFNSSQLKPLHFNADADTLLLDGVPHRRMELPISLDGAYLTTLVPIQTALQGAQARARIVVFAAFAIMGIIAAVLMRQSERLAMQRAARLDLERMVGERTSALQVANEKLVREGIERERSEERYRQSREELAQANRLGTLGQVAAGIAHEINQPVAAIRTYAENAAVFLARGQQDHARDNTDQIIALTVRIAEITKELRTFARRKPPEIGLVRLDDSIDAALLLLRYRIGRSRATVTWDRQSAALAVQADRVRLEQVFVNLIQNALDAIAGRDGGRIDLRVNQEGGEVDVDIVDNGTGIPAEVQRRLFTPFTTGRAEGLGLGLAIARDILREFGGDLTLVATTPEGTTFRIRLVHR